MSDEVDAAIHRVKRAVLPTSADASSSNAGDMKLGNGDQGKLARRDPSHRRLAWPPSVHKAQKLRQRYDLRNISVSQALMLQLRRTDANFCGFCTFGGGHRWDRAAGAAESSPRRPDLLQTCHTPRLCRLSQAGAIWQHPFAAVAHTGEVQAVGRCGSAGA